MILFVDDEAGRSSRWREALAQVEPVTHLRSAAEALELFARPAEMAEAHLVVLDLAMHTTGGLTPEETGLGRLTGEALRRRLRETGWEGPVIVLTNHRDDGVRRVVEEDGDHFRRKGECLPSALAALARELLAG